ncbi:MAG TPA: hypothetical protein DCM39_12845 [Pantoea sp.]|nr:hypothetical protein [Pantoea sp.]
MRLRGFPRNWLYGVAVSASARSTGAAEADEGVSSPAGGVVSLWTGSPLRTSTRTAERRAMLALITALSLLSLFTISFSPPLSANVMVFWSFLSAFDHV